MTPESQLLLDGINLLRSYVETRRADLVASSAEWQRVADAAQTNASRDAAAADGYARELAEYDKIEVALRAGAQPQLSEVITK
jgi:hypothetical protein